MAIRSERMSQEQTSPSDELALQRTVMAADRTLMAWTRTCVSLISFGFTIYKFLQYVRAEGASPGSAEGPRRLAMAMVGLGVAFLLVACLQFWQSMRRLQPRLRSSAWRLSLVLALMFAALGLLALANVAFRIGPF